MRAVIQRVSTAKVVVDQETIGEIGLGLMILLGVEEGDGQTDLDYLVNKIVGLRIFNDDEGKMNLGLTDVAGEILVVSQFTLLGDTRKGRRPSFIRAARPELGNELYRAFVDKLKGEGIGVAEGQFQADMQVHLVNDGPVTLLVDSRKLF